MCTLVEEYAKEKALEGRIEGRIEATVQSAIEYDRPREETISKLKEKFSLTEAQAIEYYDKYALQSV